MRSKKKEREREREREKRNLCIYLEMRNDIKTSHVINNILHSRTEND